jgi:hypothetical protein
MRSIIALTIAAAVLTGCTFKSTTVRRAEAPPPATVVYEAPPTVAYQQPAVVYAEPTRSVAVNYTGVNGFELAARKADAYCDEHYGYSDARLLSDDRIAGRATFACVQ